MASNFRSDRPDEVIGFKVVPTLGYLGVPYLLSEMYSISKVLFTITLIVNTVRVKASNRQCKVDLDKPTYMPDCGPILAQMASDCASVKHSTKNGCCPTLRKWNAGYCWCDRNANEAAIGLAGDMYGFQFRGDVCGILNMYRPSITLPNAAQTVLHSSCKTSRIDESSQISELHYLAAQRLRIAAKLAAVGTGGRPTRHLEHLVVNHVKWAEIGMLKVTGRSSVSHRLKHRGLTGWSAIINKATVTWRNADSVSYTVTAQRGEHIQQRIEFITFERDDIRVKQITTLTDEIWHLFRQFIRIDPAMRTLWSIARPLSSMHVCSRIRETCGRRAPFPDDDACAEFYKTLLESQMACLKFDNHSSLQLLQGNTLACRLYYLALAADDSSLCTMLGTTAAGQCAENKCAQDGYGSLSVWNRPMFDWQPKFECSSTNCIDEWPMR